MNRFAKWLTAVALLAVAMPAQDAEAKPTTGTVRGTFITEVLTRGPLTQADMVVYLEPKLPVEATTAPKTATVTQKRLQFRPQLLTIQAGTKVEFLNEDKVVHNVFLEHECCKFDSDMKTGETVAYPFEKVGAYPIVCRLHPEMAMTILVLKTPFFTAAKWKKQRKKNERKKRWYKLAFELKDVPPGEYTLRTWNKKLGAIERKITVKAGETTTVDETFQK